MTPATKQLQRELNRMSRRAQAHQEHVVIRHGIQWRDDGWPFMQSVLAPASRGTASITHFTVTADEAERFNLFETFSGHYGLTHVTPGQYVRLAIGTGDDDRAEVTMTDTPMERRTNWGVRHHAHGRVLIAGLGLGMILHPLLRPDRNRHGPRSHGTWGAPLPTVEHVTVVEKNPDVIALVAPSLSRYEKRRLTIIEADIHDFNRTRELYDTIYFDIWPTITTDNLPEIAQLHQRWKSRLNRRGPEKPWMSSWMVEHLRSERRREQSSHWW